MFWCVIVIMGGCCSTVTSVTVNTEVVKKQSSFKKLTITIDTYDEQNNQTTFVLASNNFINASDIFVQSAKKYEKNAGKKQMRTFGYYCPTVNKIITIMQIDTLAKKYDIIYIPVQSYFIFYAKYETHDMTDQMFSFLNELFFKTNQIAHDMSCQMAMHYCQLVKPFTPFGSQVHQLIALGKLGIKDTIHISEVTKNLLTKKYEFSNGITLAYKQYAKKKTYTLQFVSVF